MDEPQQNDIVVKIIDTTQEDFCQEKFQNELQILEKSRNSPNGLLPVLVDFGETCIE
jgi:hypothetical protein